MPGKQSGCADPGKQKNDANGKFWGDFSLEKNLWNFPHGVSCLFTIIHGWEATIYDATRAWNSGLFEIWHQVLHQLGVLRWMR